MGFGSVVGAGWVGGMGGVQLGVEGVGVVGLAEQGSRLWWWVLARVSVMAWVSSGWGLISMKVLWVAAAVVMAWLNRTGWRRLATQ